MAQNGPISDHSSRIRYPISEGYAASACSGSGIRARDAGSGLRDRVSTWAPFGASMGPLGYFSWCVCSGSPGRSGRRGTAAGLSSPPVVRRRIAEGRVPWCGTQGHDSMRCTRSHATGMLPSLASTRTPACGMVGGGGVTAQIGNIHLVSKRVDLQLSSKLQVGFTTLPSVANQSWYAGFDF